MWLATDNESPQLTYLGFDRTRANIINVLIHLHNNGKSKYWIDFTNRALKRLAKHTNLDNPNTVKEFIANLKTGNGYKHNLCLAYNNYCQYYKIEWQNPKYKHPSKPIRIPTTEQIDTLISYSNNPLKLKLVLSKETGLRPIETMSLLTKDIDPNIRMVYPTSAKHGNSRTLKISKTLTAMIEYHIKKNRLNPNDKLFTGTALTYGKSFRRMRNNLANKLNDPTLRTIRLYDFRHYFATRLYAKTRDILLVKQKMGHKKIETTLIYTQLLDTNEDEEYTCKTATNAKEAIQLIETGFKYITEIEGLKLFKKRK